MGLLGQGFGNFDIGLLIDDMGNDKYIIGGLEVAMICTDRIEKAIELFQKALQLKPSYKEEQNNLKNTLADMKK